MRISSLSMIGVIKVFHGYCVSRGTDKINHRNSAGFADWSICAVGQFTKSIKTRLSADQVYAKYIGPALKHYQDNVNYLDRIATNLNRADKAEAHYPTYDKLAKALAGLIK